MFIANSLPDNMDHAWTMPVLQYLRYQTDMVVVGVIGLQGTGKSTIMSLLSANAPEEDQKYCSIDTHLHGALSIYKDREYCVVYCTLYCKLM